MNIPTCPTHKKELVQGKYGWYCKTPVTKDSKGNVVEWCDYKPNGSTTEQVKEPINEWIPIKQKENLAMLKMSALKAASEVVAAEFGRPDHAMEGEIDKYTLEMADKFLKWLKAEDEV